MVVVQIRDRLPHNMVVVQIRDRLPPTPHGSSAD